MMITIKITATIKLCFIERKKEFLVEQRAELRRESNIEAPAALHELSESEIGKCVILLVYWYELVMYNQFQYPLPYTDFGIG